MPIYEKLNVNKKGTYKSISFKAFDVNMSISTEEEVLLEEIAQSLHKVFPNGFEEIDGRHIEHQFSIELKADDKLDLYRNDKLVLNRSTRDGFLDDLGRKLRVTIAEFAVSKVFLHAGVISWKGRAIVIPGKSFAGKTSLVAELIKRGALYYSDEFAILDADGKVEPYPKMLSLRGIIDDYQQVDYPVESLGGTAGSAIIPIGMVLITEYRADETSLKKREPKILSPGEGIMEILPHTVPLRNKPEFALRVLNKVASRAIIVKILRGEAKEFAAWLLNYYESVVD